jgi:nitroimidazol reductase NimA-like FMN-containing flavoprotein (pyridoxamine 5'-phosphate oxidase superfamily)
LEGDKLDCIAANPTVALSAVTKCAPTVGPKDGSFTLQYKSAMAVGKAEMVTDRDEKIEALREEAPMQQSAVVIALVLASLR